jgi:uncharacterized lipoprotein
MKVLYKILSHDADNQIKLSGDWSPRPSNEELIIALGKRKVELGAVLETAYFRVEVVDIRERQNGKVVFTQKN